MSEGTISYLIGCHNFFIHPLFVLIAWYREYGKLPAFWEIVCIFLHDVGHIGKQYLSDPAQKAEHWVLGARIAGLLFGQKGYRMVAGHSKRSGYPQSKMFIPDKKSWLYAPDWWIRSNRVFENFNSVISAPRIWKQVVLENSKHGFKNGLHAVYLEHRGTT